MREARCDVFMSEVTSHLLLFHIFVSLSSHCDDISVQTLGAFQSKGDDFVSSTCFSDAA